MSKLSTLAVAWECRRLDRGGREAIVARQQERLAELVAYARSHSRYYARKYLHLPDGPVDLAQLPPVTKPEMMAHFDEWVTDPAITREKAEAFAHDLAQIGRTFLEKYLLFTTSGSSGAPAILVHDASLEDVLAGTSLARGPYGGGDLWKIMKNGKRMAGVYATGGHYLGYSLTERLRKSNPLQARSSRIFSILDPVPQLVENLNRFKPAMLGGYPTALVLLADEQRAGRLRIDPAIITCGGEWTSPEMRAELHAAWPEARITSTYGCSEVGNMGFECEHGWMHINEDYVILEPIEADGSPTPAGKLSYSCLVTNLTNKVQPIIRYELGDRILVKGSPCACGSPMMAVKIEGRTDETLTLTGADGATRRILPLGLFAVGKETPGMGRFQVIQTAPDRLVMRLEAKEAGQEPAVFAEAQRRLSAYLLAQGLQGVSIERAAEAPQPHPQSGKFKHVWSEVKR